jgi:hypothetical protein
VSGTALAARGARAGLGALLALAAGLADAESSWQVEGVPLSPDQVDRLARDMALRTVAAVERNVEGIALEPEQTARMATIYEEVSREVYGEIVRVVAQDELDDEAKTARVRALVLEGQRKSHERLRDVLRPEQLRRYSAWEEQQVAAFQSQRFDRRRRRR